MQAIQGIRARGESLIVDVSYKGQRRTATIKGLSNREEAERKRVSILAELMHNANQTPAGMPKATTSWTMQDAFTHVQTVWAGTGGEDCQVRNARFAVDFFGASTPLEDITCEWMDGQHRREGGSSPILSQSEYLKPYRLGLEKETRAKAGGVQRRSHEPQPKESVPHRTWKEPD